VIFDITIWIILLLKRQYIAIAVVAGNQANAFITFILSASGLKSGAIFQEFSWLIIKKIVRYKPFFEALNYNKKNNDTNRYISVIQASLHSSRCVERY
jgi:hypothetical protein